MPIGARRPLTEIFEVAQLELVREAASGVEAKYRGMVNQTYMNEMPTELPEKYIRKEGFVNLMAAYSAGTVTVATGSTNILGASTSWTSAQSDSFINVSGYNRIYRVSFTNSTVMALKSSLTWVEASATGKSYQLVQDRYAVASDFAYMAKDNPENPNIVSFMINGFKQFLFPVTNEEYDRTIVPTTSAAFVKYTVKYDAGQGYLHVWPFPLNIDTMSYLYIPTLTALTEYTTGTVTLTTGTGVTGVGTLFTSINTANTFYLRNDADGVGSASVWVKLSSIASDTALTLASPFTGTSGTGITYTISEASKWPERFDDAMLFRTALIIDPDNVQGPKWQAAYDRAIAGDKGVETKMKRDSQLKSFSGQRR